MSRKIIIAIDGYSACGKSTTAREVARALGYTYIDSGAMYRAVTLYLMRNGIASDDLQKIVQELDRIEIDFRVDGDGKSVTFLNGEDVEEDIRSMEVSAKVSEVSAIRQVRGKVVEQQREFGRRKAIVMDGRDIGSVVFPEAELKVFMTADPEVRALRRLKELQKKGIEISLGEVRENVLKRDHIDETRKTSPLIKAPDARVLDNSNLSFAGQVAQILEWARAVINNGKVN